MCVCPRYMPTSHILRLLVIFLWFFDSYISNNLYTMLTEESKIISLLNPMKDCINQAITIPL